VSARRTLRFGEVSVGDELPPLEIDITATLIVAGALASRDYTEVHHDRDFAVNAGSKDIFMNILTTNGLVGRFVTDWAGPEALLRVVDIRLGAPNYPGDRMRLTGRVTACAEEEGEGLVDLEIAGANGLGHHVTGSVRLALPRA
jgi:acyl dehydratase